MIINIRKLIKPIRVFPKFIEVFWVRLFIREPGCALSQEGQRGTGELPEWGNTVHIHFEAGVKAFTAAHGNWKGSSTKLALILNIARVKHIDHE